MGINSSRFGFLLSNMGIVPMETVLSRRNKSDLRSRSGDIWPAAMGHMEIPMIHLKNMAGWPPIVTKISQPNPENARWGLIQRENCGWHKQHGIEPLKDPTSKKSYPHLMVDVRRKTHHIKGKCPRVSCPILEFYGWNPFISIEDQAFSLSNHGIHLDFQIHGSGNSIRSGLFIKPMVFLNGFLML